MRQRGHDLVKKIRDKDVGKYTNKIVNFLEGAAVSVGKLVFDLVLIVVISIYMLLGMPRLAAAIDRRFPSRPRSDPLLVRMSKAVVSYVRGQVLVSLIIGTSVGVGMWVLGVTGLVPGADHYALLFGAFAAITELIPYLGPILGAVPPVLYALVVHPISAIWVVVLFLFIHQIEGHVVVPNVMGSALRLHPLLVIFGLLAGGAIYGFPGVLVALPFLAACRAAWEFFCGAGRARAVGDGVSDGWCPWRWRSNRRSNRRRRLRRRAPRTPRRASKRRPPRNLPVVSTFPGHPPAAPAPHRRAPGARRRDAARHRRRGHAALRLHRSAAERGAAGDGPAHRRRARARGGRARARGCPAR